MYLMHRSQPIMEIDIDKSIYKILNESLLPIRLKGAITDNRDFNRDRIIEFLASRVINIDRTNAKKLLNAFHFTQSQELTDKARIAVTCKAVSMTDCFWIKQESDPTTWDEINPQANSLNQIVTHIALTGSSLTLTGRIHTPELTGHGSYAKAWVREKDGIYLYKRSTKDGQESEKEVMTSNILDCFYLPHVIYLDAQFDNFYVCKCKNMCNDNLSIVTAEDVYRYCSRNSIDFMKFILDIDKDAVYKMCIIDYLISNSDRHLQNWGFYVNNNTGNLLCCHPLYDHTNAFDDGDMEASDGGESQIMPGHSKKEVALYCIKETELVNKEPIKRKLFMNETMYDTFMKRCTELDLYHPQKPNFFQKIHILPYEKFIPNKIIADDQDKLMPNYEQKRKLDDDTISFKDYTDEKISEYQAKKKNIEIDNKLDSQSEHILTDEPLPKSLLSASIKSSFDEEDIEPDDL